MKIFISLLFLLFLGRSSIAAIDPVCTELPITINANINTVLSGNTICTADSQEQHRSGNELWDYKKGSDPVDHTSRVGSWEVSNSQVKYTYGGDVFNTNVYSNATDLSADGITVCFHNGKTKVTAIKKNGITGPCPGF
jgi:hypothetical protein